MKVKRSTIVLVGILILWCAQGNGAKPKATKKPTSNSAIKAIPKPRTKAEINDRYFPILGPGMSKDEIKVCNDWNLNKLEGDIYFVNITFTWRKAQECCTLKNLTLLKEPIKHLKVLNGLGIGQGIDHEDYFTQPWVGTNDIIYNGRFEWTSGEIIPKNQFQKGEPNNLAPGEHCGQVDAAGLVNDYYCYVSVSFLCEDLPPPTGETPTPEQEKTCDKINYEEVGGIFRRQKNKSPKDTVNWPLATKCCAKKGWKLPSLNELSPTDQQTLANHLGAGGFPYWTSGSNLVNRDVFAWDTTGEILPTDSPLWEAGSPQKFFMARHCIQVSSDNTTKLVIRDVSCDIPLRILCQIPPPIPSRTCCIASDTATEIQKPGPYKLEFRPTSSKAQEAEMGVSLNTDLSPSKATKFDWSAVWTRYLEEKGKNPVKFPPTVIKPPKQSDKCITKFYTWIRYVATCGNTTLTYVDGPMVISAYNESTLCPTAKCEPLCNASDKWRQIAVYKVNGLDSRSDSNDEPEVGANVPPCLDFIPPIDPNDPINARVIYEFLKLSPSPNTGVDWRQYYHNKTTIENFRPNYEIKGDDYPPGSFVNIYDIEGTCGEHTTSIRVFKLVPFTTGQTKKNCQIAKREKVPLNGC